MKDDSLLKSLEPNEEILWDWEPDTKNIAIENYFEFGAGVIVVTAILWLVFPSIWLYIQKREIAVVAFFSFIIIVPTWQVVCQARDLGLFQRKFSMERYVITDRRLLIRNRKHPRWLTISYDKMESLNVHASGLSIDGSVRNIDVLWVSEKGGNKKKTEVKVTRMSHVEGWEEAVEMIYSRKFNVPTEEAGINSNFIKIMVR